MTVRKRRWALVALSIFGCLAIPLTCLALAMSSLIAMSPIPFRLGWGPVWEDSVAVVRVEGVITSGREYSEAIIELLNRAEDDPAVKAIVLRVDSPGGSVVGSDEIYGALREMEKPLVVSMGDMAASGGYYISCAADVIMANPATLTGSIGVIASTPNYEELLDKIGIEMLIIKSGPMKDELSPYREPTEEEIAHWQGIVDEAYEQFVRIVAEGRNLSAEETKKLADGRVYTGRQALDLNLIDELGDLPQAIDLAAELGGVEGEPRVIEYQRLPTLIEMFLTSLVEPPSPVSLDEFIGAERRFTVQYLYISP